MAPVSTLDAAWAALNKARDADEVDGSNRSASTIWPTLFVMTVPPPARMVQVQSSNQDGTVLSISVSVKSSTGLRDASCR